MLTVSIGIVALNEEKCLPFVLEDLSNQDYPHNLIEIILVDGISTDNTYNIMTDFQKNNKSFKNVKVIKNPKHIQAAGWNLVIKEASHDVVTRIDAHTKIPFDFISKNMKLQEDGEFVTGGRRPCLIENPTKWKEALLECENSLFGSGIGKSRHSNEKCYVDTMFHASYRKEVLNKVGGFNENLLRTEDNEFHYRIRKEGYKFCFDPNIVSYQYARNSFKKMIKQKYQNGYWIGITLYVCPKCLSLYHLIPFAFLVGVILTSILAGFNYFILLSLMWSLYLLFTLVSTVFSFINTKKFNLYYLLMPFMFLILHLSYGLGTFIGLFSFNKIIKIKKTSK